jgi:uncharacterized protein (DUF2147 family)
LPATITALCGYVLNLSSNAKGETVLINMTPKAAALWSGNIYSRDSGNTYDDRHHRPG